MDTGGWYGARKYAYGIEYGLRNRMGFRMVTNFDWLLNHGEFMDESCEGQEFGISFN